MYKRQILNEDNQSRDRDQVALVIQDRYTHWIQAFAAPSKSAHATVQRFERFLGPQCKAKHVYSDNSKELKSAMQILGFLHDTCTPYTPATNGVAERSVRRVKEGTRAMLTQSGLNGEWWSDAMESYCFLRNVQDIITLPKSAVSPGGTAVPTSDGNVVGTPYELRFKEPFKGPRIP